MSASADKETGSGQYVTFACGGRALAISILAVREIRSWSPVTPLPAQPRGAAGVLDIRGSVIEVFDLGALLDMPSANKADGSQVVLVVALNGRGVGRDVGLMVDAVSDIIFAGPEDTSPAPAGGQSRLVSHLVRNDGQIVAVLDLEALLPAYPDERVFLF